MLSDRRKLIINTRAKTGYTHPALMFYLSWRCRVLGVRLVHLEWIGELQPADRQRRTETIVGHDLPREEMATLAWNTKYL
jgi:hypothetical protein